VLNLVNRHLDQPMDVEFQLQDKSFTGEAVISEVNGPDIKAENDFGVQKVKVAERRASASGKTLSVRLPAHSFSMVRVKLG